MFEKEVDELKLFLDKALSIPKNKNPTLLRVGFFVWVFYCGSQ